MERKERCRSCLGSPLFLLEDLAFSHEAKVSPVEVFVTEMDEGRTGAEVFVEKSEGFRSECLINAAVDEGDLAVVELFEGFG